MSTYTPYSKCFASYINVVVTLFPIAIMKRYIAICVAAFQLALFHILRCKRCVHLNMNIVYIAMYNACPSSFVVYDIH